jgi:N-acetylglucosamine kinase
LRVVVGVDGGVTATKVLVAGLDGHLLTSRRGPGVNPHRGLEATALSLLETLQEAVASVKGRLEGVCLGVTGTESEEVRSGLEKALAHLLPRVGLKVVHDSVIAAVGALGGQDGVVIYAGTGSFVAGVKGPRFLRVGGYGFLMSDEGSGYRLGEGALRAVTRAYDGWGTSTKLMDEVLRHFGAERLEDLPPKLYEPFDTMQVAALAPIVLRVAEEGDPVARQLVEAAVNDLARMAVRVARRLRLAPPIRVALVGGVFDSPYYRGLVANRVTGLLKGARPVSGVLPPVGGALLLALRELGVSPRAEQLRQLVGELRSRGPGP